MSRVYDKSRSDKYKKYFTSTEELAKLFSVYSLEERAPLRNQAATFRPWDTGRVGVPLAWNSTAKTISVDHMDTHTLIIGPTGSKKSRLVIMPLVRILGSTGESMIISDPKAEIYNRTAAYLEKQKYNIFVLNLRSPMHGQRWNPLAIPYDFYIAGEINKAYEFVNDIAENLIQSNKSNTDPFWDNSAGSFFFGLALLLFKCCKEHGLGKEYVHMGNLVRLRNVLLYGPKGKIHTQLWDYAKTDPIILSAMIGTVETANDTKAGILSVFDQKVRMFSIQPNILDMLGANDIDLDMISKAPTAVFLVVPDEKTGYHGLVSLFIKQSYEYMIFHAQADAERDGFHVATLKNRVNYILDEFSSLPTIQDFPAMVTAARSRNIRFTLAIQSKHQLIRRYQDETDTIQTNCSNWIFLTSREPQMLEEISSLCGKTIEDNAQPVLSVTDLQRLDKDAGEALILCGRLKPCISRLPDIELYDSGQFERLPVTVREQQAPPAINVNALFPSAEPTINKKSPPMYEDLPGIMPPFSPADLDRMMEEIDKKIAELEKEENRNRDKEAPSESQHHKEEVEQ